MLLNITLYQIAHLGDMIYSNYLSWGNNGDCNFTKLLYYCGILLKTDMYLDLCVTNFAIKVLNIGISPSFLHKKEENGNSNIHCKFQLHSMHIFFQNGDLKFFGVATTLPPTPELWRLTLPPPSLGLPPKFFHQNDRKGCKVKEVT